MRKLFLSVAVLLAAIPTFGQPKEEYTAPVKWERYRVGDGKITLMFPKKPVSLRRNYWCSQHERVSYYAYAEDAVYELSVNVRNKDANTSFCRKVTKFSEAVDERIAELKAKDTVEESRSNGATAEVITLTTATSRREIVRPLKQDFWLELAVIARDIKKVDTARFLGSLGASPAATDIDLRESSDRTLGDAGVDAPVAADAPKDAAVEKLVIVAKAPPGYTTEARQAGVRGELTLRVTFLASGGIGDIVAIKGLSHGLTEKAIEAAKKIVFLPEKRNGVNVTVSRPVQYSFSIY